jgi:hypothetical protein
VRAANFDAIKVGELSIDFLQPTPILTAKAAFVNTQNGNTYGWTTGVHWSVETVKLVADLRASMTKDLEYVHFGDNEANQPPLSSAAREAIPQGIGEFLTNVPQV